MHLRNLSRHKLKSFNKCFKCQDSHSRTCDLCKLKAAQLHSHPIIAGNWGRPGLGLTQGLNVTIEKSLQLAMLSRHNTLTSRLIRQHNFFDGDYIYDIGLRRSGVSFVYTYL